MNETDKTKLRDDMNHLHGMIDAIKFPLVWSSDTETQAYYDLLDSIESHYDSIKQRVFEVIR